MSGTGDGSPTYEVDGDRLWIALPFGSPLKDLAKALGARWDPATKRWWVNSDHAPQVRELLDGEVARRREFRSHAEQVRQTGVAVSIPFARPDICAVAAAVGGVWDKTTKRWFIPAGSDVVQRLLAEHFAEQPADRATKKPRPAAKPPVARDGPTPPTSPVSPVEETTARHRTDIDPYYGQGIVDLDSE